MKVDCPQDRPLSQFSAMPTYFQPSLRTTSEQYFAQEPPPMTSNAAATQIHRVGTKIWRFIFCASVLMQTLKTEHSLFVQLKIGPGTVIVLTDVAAVKELMDRRSATTADRPPIHVADLTTGGLHMVSARSSWLIQLNSSSGN